MFSAKTIGAVALGAAAIGLSVGSVAPAEAASVDFTNQGTFTTSSFSQNGLTITGSNTLNFTSNAGIFSGLGVVGGVDYRFADSGESVFFSFAPGGASSVSLLGQMAYAADRTGGGSPPPFGIEGFDVNGISLGVASFPVSFSLPPYNIDISGLFSNTTLSGFRFSTAGGGVKENGTIFKSIDFTPATSIPTPALLPGLLGMGIAAWRKRKNEEPEQVAETVEV